MLNTYPTKMNQKLSSVTNVDPLSSGEDRDINNLNKTKANEQTKNPNTSPEIYARYSGNRGDVRSKGHFISHLLSVLC